MKKITFILLIFFGLVPIVCASNMPLTRIGNRYYSTLEEAIQNASSDDVISLISNVNLEDSLVVNKVVNINLNGNDITADEKVFMVKGGFFTLTGKGTIRETKPNYGAIMLVGSTNSADEKYSVVNVGKDVTLEGWSGIFINHDSKKSYGVHVNLEGKINAVKDISGGTGIGIYVNGHIKEEEAHPVVNIMDGAKINSTGNGLYIAGYSTFNIGDAYIEGDESAIGIKSGKLIIDGATLVCNGEDYTPTSGYQNGIKPSGATIQIESNNGYKGKMEIDISSGSFISKNSNVIYEYLGRGNNSEIYSMSISGGTFTSGKSKDIFSLSNSFKNIHSGFISGGKYSTNPNEYLKSGYKVVEDNNKYSVIKSSMKEVVGNNYKENNKNNFIKSLFFILIISLSLIYIYMNKKYNILKMYK